MPARTIPMTPNERRVMQMDEKFYGTIRKAKDGSVVLPDQFVVFLAKDDAFYALLPEYRSKCIELGSDEEQIASVDRMIARITAWREANPDKCHPPNAKGEKLLR